MLYWPARSRFNSSSRFPGGERRNSSVSAASSWASFRVATLEIEPKRFERPVSKSPRVSAHRKPLITTSLTIYRLSVYGKTVVTAARGQHARDSLGRSDRLALRNSETV